MLSFLFIIWHVHWSQNIETASYEFKFGVMMGYHRQTRVVLLKFLWNSILEKWAMLCWFPAQDTPIPYLGISARVIYWKLCMIIGYHNETKVKHTMEFSRKIRENGSFLREKQKLLYMNLDLARWWSATNMQKET